MIVKTTAEMEYVKHNFMPLKNKLLIAKKSVLVE